MKKSTIKRLCDAKGFNRPELFIEFFSLRFPDESDRIESYCNEWIDRFMSGSPEIYMDSESKSIYLSLLSKR